MHGSSGGNGREKACLIVNTSECVGIGRFLGGAEHIYIYIHIIFISTKQEALCTFTDMNYKQYTILS